MLCCVPRVAATALFTLLLALVTVAGVAAQEVWTSSGPVDVDSATTILARDYADPTTVYAATWWSAGRARVESHLFRSNDLGTSWTEITGDVTDVLVTSLVVDPTRIRALYLGGQKSTTQAPALYRTDDGGDSWRALPWPAVVGGQSVRSIAVSPVDGQIVYVGTTEGLARSTDGGMTWAAVTGLPRASVESIAISALDRSIVYAAGTAGVYRSRDGGVTWQPISAGLTPLPTAEQPVTMHALTIDPRDGRAIYVVVSPSSGGDRVFRSSDGGDTWRQLGAVPGAGIRDLALNTLRPSTMYATLVADGNVNLARTLDGGSTWTALSVPGTRSTESVVIDVRTPGQTLYVSQGGRVWTSPVAPDPAARDERYFAQTGFAVETDAFWDYFNRRGGVKMFGYPTSRAFLFRGRVVQFFQRSVIEQAPDGSTRLINLLDPELLPYTSFNNAVVPAPDPAVMGAAPAPDSPNYDRAIIDYVYATAPNSFDGRPVNFGETFRSTVTMAIAFPHGDGIPALLPGMNLELWGVPISRPAYDPNNRNFIYQRFQRGIMHYDAGCQCTNGLLLADYLKAIITGQNLPADVAAQAAGSRFFQQYDPSKPRWVARPDALPDTDLTNAFTPR